MLKKTVKLIEGYIDQNGNNIHGNIVYKAEQDDEDEDFWIILEPVPVTEELPYVLKTSFIVIKADAAKVGFYTVHSYYVLMKSLGFTKILNDKTRAWLEKSTRDASKNTSSWYSNGLEINKDINSSQKTLF